MTPRVVETDYLVIGAGAMGLAFVDELLARRPDQQVVLVDKRAKPGGHWNDAYSYVSLHQPAAFYGVNSEKLGSGGAALATGTEVLAYYERVLDKLLRTGHLQYFPMCEYRGNRRFDSLIAPGESYQVNVRAKTVDSTYMNVEVPSTTPPKYSVAPGATVVPPNDLPRVAAPQSRYVVIGAGKTGMDAVLFLVGQRVDPASITWIVSNDAWLLDRDHLAPGQVLGWFVDQLELIARSSTLQDVYAHAEAKKSLLRLDPLVWPSKFRCATVNRHEAKRLRAVKNVVRMGRVVSVQPDSIVLQGGEVPTDGHTLHVDCTADGLAKRAPRPVFDGNHITLQSLFMCQQVFSASLIGYLESRYEDELTKNELCQVVPHPEFNRDYVSAMATSYSNIENWTREISGWLRKSRLSLAHHESPWRLLVNLRRIKRIGPLAAHSMRQILREEHAAQSIAQGAQ